MSSASSSLSSANATSTASAIASCISITPDKNGYVPEWACNANYNYYPSFGAALFFTIIFVSDRFDPIPPHHPIPLLPSTPSTSKTTD